MIDFERTQKPRKIAASFMSIFILLRLYAAAPIVCPLLQRASFHLHSPLTSRSIVVVVVVVVASDAPELAPARYFFAAFLVPGHADFAIESTTRATLDCALTGRELQSPECTVRSFRGEEEDEVAESGGGRSGDGARRWSL